MTSSSIQPSRYVPTDAHQRCLYFELLPGGGLQPWEYTGWRNETASWHETCYIHSNINPQPTHVLSGPDALQVISDRCVNTVKNWEVNKGKHLILCDEQGILIAHGVCVRTGEDTFVANELMILAYFAERGGYDCTVEDKTDTEFLFQFCGPRALEVMENAVREDLHDLRFMQQRSAQIAERDVRILRMGMAGSLGYEVHGDVNDALAVYAACLDAGRPFGLRQLGARSYSMAHSEGGFPQWLRDFPAPWGEDPEILDWLESQGRPGRGPAGAIWGNKYTTWNGSMGADVTTRVRDPFALGWGNAVKFDHDFVGREALEKLAADPRRTMVTLLWNKEDILDVHRSQLEPGEPFMPLDGPVDDAHIGGFAYHADMVLRDGEEVGISTGRAQSHHYRVMFSLCSIDVAHAQLGTEVMVRWGSPGTRQKDIRATVGRYPLMNEGRNQTVDVDAIPRLSEGDRG